MNTGRISGEYDVYSIQRDEQEVYMNPQAVTIASGIIFIVVLILVGLHQRRRHRQQNADIRNNPERDQ